MHSARPAVSVLASVDPVLRESTALGLVLGSPATVVVRHDIQADAGTLRRVVVSAGGVIEDETVPLEHACLSCAVREDALPTIARLAEDGRWDAIVLALPVGAESLPATRALCAHAAPGEILAHVRVAGAVAVVDLAAVEEDLLGDALLAERGLALTGDDGRAVGEALAAQLEHADLVVTEGDPAAHPTGSGLVDRLRAVDSRRLDGLHALTAADVTTGTHDPACGERRANPVAARGGAPARTLEGDRSWTLELHTPRPLHPERLLERIEDLGAARVRARGVFWVPSRPDSACLWDGAGGQLAVGDLGPWRTVAGAADRHTRIVMVGSRGPDGQDDRRRLRATFADVVARPEEVVDGGLAWLGRPDVLAPWLGSRGELDEAR